MPICILLKSFLASPLSKVSNWWSNVRVETAGRYSVSLIIFLQSVAHCSRWRVPVSHSDFKSPKIVSLPSTKANSRIRITF